LYFDVRKDSLYCDPPSSLVRQAALTVIDEIFQRVSTWFAPILAFTCEEAFIARTGSADSSVHLQTFPATPAEWRNDELAAKWRVIRNARRIVTGALEIERASKRIGSSLEAAPVVYVADDSTRAILASVDFSEVCITSGLTLEAGEGPEGAFRDAEAPGISVAPVRASGVKCARSWRYFDPAFADPEFPEVSPRDARALRELKAKSA
jgi:isoleucyl-tRNA synthetase